MENNQNTPNKPQRKKRALVDMLIPALGILVLWRVDWGNMNSFHYLIIFMFFLCLMLRWGNLRKAEEAKRKRKEYMAQKAAYEAAYAAAQKTAAQSSAKAAADGEAAEVTETPAAEEVVTETVSAEEKPAE